MIKTLRTYIKLARLHSSVLLGVAPVCGAIAMGVVVPFWHYLALFAIGVMVHIYWFVLNEYVDIEVDKKSNDLSGKPLVSGAISPRSALAFLLAGLFGCFAMLLLFPPERVPFMALSVGITVAAGGIYDFFGKRIVIADYVLAFVPSSLCLAGAFSVSSSLTPLAIGIMAIAYLQGLGQNVAAGMKDVDHDYLAGANTTPLRLGVKVIEGKITIPALFTGYMIAITASKGLAALLPLYFGARYTVPQLIFLLIMLLGVIALVAKFCTMKIFVRDKLIRQIGVHEIFTWALAPVMLAGIIGPTSALLLCMLPIVWLFVFLKIQYGSFKPEI